MSATTKNAPRTTDPRVVRSRSAARAAARDLFLAQGYAGTTMEQIAELAGLTKRTLYNNYPDKESLFLEIVDEVIDYADVFARELREEIHTGITERRFTKANLHETLHELGARLARRIIRPEVIALRRLLIGEARGFPSIGRDYFNRAPAQVMDVLAWGFGELTRLKLLRAKDSACAAAQFAYLVAGEPLDRAMLTGILPKRTAMAACAREGVETFLARFA